jgi:hypothetical protein
MVPVRMAESLFVTCEMDNVRRRERFEAVSPRAAGRRPHETHEGGPSTAEHSTQELPIRKVYASLA